MSDPLVSGIGVCPGVVRGEAKSPTFREGYRGAIGQAKSLSSRTVLR